MVVVPLIYLAFFELHLLGLEINHNMLHVYAIFKTTTKYMRTSCKPRYYIYITYTSLYKSKTIDAYSKPI